MPDFDIARRWLEQCTSSHAKCQTGDDNHQAARSNAAVAQVPLLPTRVIYVGLGQEKEPHLLMTRNRRAQYVALSHCWGNARPLVTDSSNLLAHLESIPLASMPSTFCDAVITTRKLGFQFLWIDSLCIIQDSSQDWERECSNMAHIYQNAALTICGPAASDCNAGFLHARASPQSVPCHWEYRNSRGGELKRATFRLAGDWRSTTYPDNPWLTEEEKDSPLRQRGWVFQEYLLSPRLLFLGTYRMYWECNTCTQFEDFLAIQDSSSKGLHSSIAKATVGPLRSSSESAQWMKWYLIVQEYSLRSLTRPLDKLPALSGVANWQLGGRPDAYLAGLLKSSLHVGLTWRTNTQPDPRVPELEHRGPSWSWVSTDYPVVFTALDRPYGFPRDNNLGWDQIMPKQTGLDVKMQVHHVQVKLHGQNAFGEVESGSIKLRGRVKKGLIIYQTRFLGDPFRVCDSNLEEAQVRNNETSDWMGIFYSDDFREWLGLAGGWRSTTSRSSLSSTSTTNKRDIQDPNSSISLGQVECLCIGIFDGAWVGLVVEPLPLHQMPSGYPLETQKDTYRQYRRIGVIVQDSRLNWFSNGTWELIELV